MSKLMRLLRHLWLDARDAERALGKDGLDRIERRITESERLHCGQICVCVEASLPLRYLWRHLGRGEPIEAVIADRALTMFGKQRVWDTEHNNGVLIYVLLADRRVEIVADRGIHACCRANAWTEICRGMEERFAKGDFGAGSVLGIEAVTGLLACHFPVHSDDHNELPDNPVVL